MIEKQRRLRASFWHVAVFKLCFLSEERTSCFNMSSKGTEIREVQRNSTLKDTGHNTFVPHCLHGIWSELFSVCDQWYHYSPGYRDLIPTSHTEPLIQCPCSPCSLTLNIYLLSCLTSSTLLCGEAPTGTTAWVKLFHITCPNTDVFKLNYLSPGWISSPFVNVTDAVT